MHIDEIRDLVAYTEWATARLTEALRAVPDAARRRRDDSAFGSLHGTFAHLIAAEWVWVERWNGRSPSTPPEWVGVASFDELLGHLDTVQRDRADVIARQDATALVTPIPYRTFAGVACANTVGELIRHVVNHGTYHRGQISMRLRQLGELPPSTDYVLWLRLPAPRVPSA